ncbi:glycine-rich domain-containing protein [Methylotetracoccus oryzae]|uniref:glycine-rich domain-containing protein n=1 Tax=Methylotetracoccus oryzae TaxID=1919059 RepID=UPI001118C9C5|nr:hypothetical protein [Methylotetracoccus oryzae]
MNEWLVVIVLIVASVMFWRHERALRREAYIRAMTWPDGLFDGFRKRRPELTPEDCELVGQGLCQFFLVYLKSGRQFVSMPSQIVDDLWHEFILYTKHYQLFCSKAFGRFLHHTPASVLGSERQSNAGLRRCWWFACCEEGIDPRAATRLPLLFTLDATLDIPDGFHYEADCESARRTDAGGTKAHAVYCVGDFSSTSFDGTTDGFADQGFAGGDGAGDGGSCGGD